MKELWPTAVASELYNRSKPYSQGGTPLTLAIARREGFPTPCTTGFSNGSGNVNKANRLAEQGVLTEEERRSFRAGNGGQLNPDWTEWLMGWPVGWTSLNPLKPEDVEAWLEAMRSGCWWDVDPADAGRLSRLTVDGIHRADRLKAIGNGQVPLCVLEATTILAAILDNTKQEEG